MQQHDTETKAQAIAMHMAGESNRAIARQLGVDEKSVRTWIKQPADHPAPQKTKAWLDDQVWGLISDTIESIRAVARQAQNPEWLNQQSANDLGVYTGVQSDKLIRVLGALEFREEQAEQSLIAEQAGPDA